MYSMELIKEILIKHLQESLQANISIDMGADLEKAIQSTSVIALNQIKMILDDDTLSDFMCIEHIIQVFERIGSGIDNRHDVG